jgi:hypothetical protein
MTINTTGDGLVRPLNAPAGQQVLPGVQPGTTSGVVLAQFVIIFGATGGMFVYSGTPGPGNPPVYSVSSATTDPYGNTIEAGIWAGQFGGTQAGLQVNGSLGQLAFPVASSSAATVAGISGKPQGTSGSVLQVFSAKDTAPNNDQVIAQFGDHAAQGTSAVFFLSYVDSNGTGWIDITMGNGGMALNSVNPLTGILPGTGTSSTNPAQPETWHQATLAGTWTGSANGVNGLFYRIVPDGSGGTVEVIGDLINTTATGNSTIFTLPSGYRPAQNQNHPAGWNDPAVNNSASAPWLSVSGAGVLQLAGIEVANKEIFVHAFLPLNVSVATATPPAFVQSTPGGTGTASPVTVTLPAPSTAGNTIVVWVVTSGSPTNGTVSGITLGGAAGNFAQAIAPVGTPATASETLMIWADANCAGGQTSIVVSVSAFTGSIVVVAAEFSHLPTTATVDVSATQNVDTGSAAWSSTATASSTHSPALAIGGVGTFNGAGMTITGPAGPWVNLAQVTSASTHVGLVAGYQILSGLTAVTYSGTVTAATDYAAAAAVLEGN